MLYKSTAAPCVRQPARGQAGLFIYAAACRALRRPAVPPPAARRPPPAARRPPPAARRPAVHPPVELSLPARIALTRCAGAPPLRGRLRRRGASAVGAV